jgi:hypothetical protein
MSTLASYLNKSVIFGSTVCLIFFLLGSAMASEQKKAARSTSQDNSQNKPLPHCVNDPATLEAIDQDRKLNTKTELKYKSIERALASDSNEELTARLVYAETLAANCPQFESEMVAPIASAIKNRTAKRNGNTRSVVFQRDQFASSLNGYDESHWREFLCPTNAELWQKAYRATMAPNSVHDGFNYYLFKHSTRFSPPDWAKKEPLKFLNSEKIADCLKVFKATFK